MGEKLTKAQIAMLNRAAARGTDGVMCCDGVEALVASRLAAKGYVTLPAGHGYYFSPLLRVRLTEAGRAILTQKGE